MKIQTATINGALVVLNIPETAFEFREGARLCANSLGHNEGFYFDFRSRQTLFFENSSVPYDLHLLFFDKFDTYGVVLEAKLLKANSSTIVRSTEKYTVAVELRRDFCEENKIYIGSLLTKTWKT